MSGVHEDGEDPYSHKRYEGFPPGFFDRVDSSADDNFYAQPRMVTHIDDRAIRAVGDLYAELKIGGRVLDLMSSWVSHFVDVPEDLVVLRRGVDMTSTLIPLFRFQTTALTLWCVVSPSIT